MVRFTWHRKETPWEVVEQKSVNPIPVYYDDEDIDIVSVSDTDTCGTYVFDYKKPGRWQNAIIFAKQQLLVELQKRDYNALLLEGWRLTVFRKGNRYRVEVQYSGRGATVIGKENSRPPPFLDLITRGDSSLIL